ncbi:MAG: hypothetical protein ABJG78_14880 [Cyclobacteriaceae bacterium]
MKYLLFVCLFTCALGASAQEEDIVSIIDDLTAQWDKQALSLERYTGLKYYCTSDQYSDRIIDLLDDIHHYDTLLYGIVTRKYADTKDKEAEATLKDIITVEADYTTKNFKLFLQKECEGFTEIEESKDRSSGSKYYKEIEKLEKELSKYVVTVTKRIDLIDEHIHHLKLD